MGLLDYLQQDPNKQEALRQGLLSAGIAMMGSQSPNFLGSAAQGATAGMQAYTKQFEEQKRKIAQQQAIQSATTPAKPSTPAVYKVGGQSLPQLGQAQSVAENMFSLPKAANPYSAPIVQDVRSMALKPEEPAYDMPLTQQVGIDDMSGGMPAQIEEQAAQPAQAGGLDIDKLAQSVISNPDASPELQEFAIKYLSGKKPEKPIVLGKSLIDPVTNKVIATDETWREEKDVARKQRMEEITMQLEDRGLARQDSAALRRELAEQQAALRRDLASQASADRRAVASMASAQGNKPPSGYRYTRDGNLEQIPGGPADLKRQAQLEGGGTVDTVIAGLRDAYNQLDEKGGITNTDNRAGSNLAAGIQSSAAGQATGKLFGTESQSLRNTVAQQRPILLQAIMRATGMSAKQLDSNTELKLYLSTATDPTLDLQTNKRALDMLEKLYGSGKVDHPKQPSNVNQLPKKPATNPKYPGFSIAR